jgi:hypothetical protein
MLRDSAVGREAAAIPTAYNACRDGFLPLLRICLSLGKINDQSLIYSKIYMNYFFHEKDGSFP